jgi:Uma2 family endonuclease
MNPASSGVKLTYDDYLLFPDDGNRHELIDGEHYATPPPRLSHQAISGNLHLLIGSWLETHPIGRIYYAPVDLVFLQFDVVEPDLLFASTAGLAEIATTKNMQGAPELVIEIGSPGTRKRDETIKKRLYERWGVDEYWIVDGDTDVVRIYRRESAGFGRVAELSREAGDVLTTVLLPGLELPLSRVFRA